MPSVEEIRHKVEKIGWRSLSDELWNKLDDFKDGVVILAPPLDTVPSSQGNAIYTIVHDLAEHAPVPCLVLSIWPNQGEPKKSNISDRILYCQNPFKPILFEKYIPYRIKKVFWGTGRPELLHYAKKATNLCKILGIKTIIIEDIPRFGLPFRSRLPSGTSIFLHQHIDGPLSYSKFWWKKIVKAFSGIIFVAQKTLDDTEKKHGILKNATVVYNGIDLTNYNPDNWKETALNLRLQNSIAPTDLVVFYIGRVIPGKGCLELVNAFLEAAVPDTKLVLAGDLHQSLFSTVKYSDQIRHLIKDNSNNVISIGNVNQKDIPGWYEVSDIVVVPSIQSEGLPRVITEALVMGKPILASKRGGAFELIKPGRNGWLLENPQDINQFSHLLQDILRDREKIKEFGQNALSQDRPKLSIENSVDVFFRYILDPSAIQKNNDSF